MTVRKHVGWAMPTTMLFLGWAVPTLQAQSGGAYIIKKSTIDGGGVTSHTGGAYRLGGTVGQHDAGPISGGGYALTGGFWSAASAGPSVSPPAVAPAPFNQGKNRYVSFAPLNSGTSVAFRVRKLANAGGGTGRCTVTGNACTGGIAPPAFAQGTCAAGQSCISSYLTGNPGGDCWVQTPTQTANIIPSQNVQFQAVCGLAPVFRIWTESVVHVHGCPIIPATQYEIFTNGVGPVENPVPLPIGTAGTPSLNNKLWGDNVGINNGLIWTAPNSFCNVQDVLSLQAILSGAAIRPTHSVANVRGGSSADGCVNSTINASDVLAIVSSIAGASYGPPATTQPVDPAAAGCKLCPSFP